MEATHSEDKTLRDENFLTPEQRAQAIAKIMSDIAVGILKERHEHQDI